MTQLYQANRKLSPMQLRLKAEKDCCLDTFDMFFAAASEVAMGDLSESKPMAEAEFAELVAYHEDRLFFTNDEEPSPEQQEEDIVQMCCQHLAA